MWTLIGVGATRLFIVEADQADPDRAVALVGSWSLASVRMSEEGLERSIGSAKLGAYHAIRFEFPRPRRRGAAARRARGRRAPRGSSGSAAEHAGSDGLTEVTLVTTATGPFDEDIHFVLTYVDGATKIGSARRVARPSRGVASASGFDNDTFVRAMAATDQGMAVLWRANTRLTAWPVTSL